MKKSELKQLIKEVIIEQNNSENYSPNVFKEALDTIKKCFSHSY